MREALSGVALEAGVDVRVGTAALVPGDAPAPLLRRAEADARDDPGPGPRARRASAALDEGAAALLRAALDGDAQAVEICVRSAFARYGSPGAFDAVLQPAAGRLRRAGEEAPPGASASAKGRSPAGHRALALMEWAVARRVPAHPPPDAPVAVVAPLGTESRCVAVPAVCDAAAQAGWMPVVLQMPPAADLAPPLRRLGAGAVVAVVGDDADLSEAGHLLRALGDSLDGVPLFAHIGSEGLLTRWTPPPPALPVRAATLLAELLAHLRAHPAPGTPGGEPSDPAA